MENLINSLSKAKKQLIKLKYIEINIKSRCSIRNMIENDVKLSLDCNYENYRFPDFLFNYLYVYYDVFNPNPIERIISLNYKQEDYVYNLKLEDIPKSAFFFQNSINSIFIMILGVWLATETTMNIVKKTEKKMLILSLNFLLHTLYTMVKVLKKLLLSLKTLTILKNANFQSHIRLFFEKYLNQKTELREIEALIIKEIQESVPYAKPKNLVNYHEKSLIFLSKDMNITQRL
nr:hypothetical protein [Mesomycoplasma ovipneumoniae]